METLREIQEACQAWLDNMPENVQSSPLAERLEEACSLDLDPLDVELPRGFGRN